MSGRTRWTPRSDPRDRVTAVSPLTRNIFANFGGQAATTVIAFVTVPLFLRFLGPEGYGLVSILLVLQALTAVLDFGLSTTANREVTRYVAQARPPEDRHDLVRTLEVFFYAVGVLLLIAFAAGSSWLATRWLTSPHFDASTVRTAVFVAGAAIAMRWPVALYQGILRGTEEHVVLNVVTSASNLIRGVGSILVLLFIARSVLVFYWWQLAFSALELVICLTAVGRYGQGFTGGGGRFRAPLLRDLWRFSASVGGMSLFALFLKQADKLIVSALLPLSALGFYNAASLASNGLSKVAQPVQAAVFPRLTHLHQQRDDRTLAQTFHRTVRAVAFLSAPLAALLMFNAHDVLLVWTQNAELAASARTALAILAAAMMFNSLMGVPFSLLLAAGLTRVPLAMNAAGALLLTPLTYVLVLRHGITGAAAGWLLFNVLYFLIVPFVMFRHVLQGEYRTWLTRDTFPFVVSALACFGAARWVAGGAAMTVRAGLAAAAMLLYLALVVEWGLRPRGGVRARWVAVRALLRPGAAASVAATAPAPGQGREGSP